MTKNQPNFSIGQERMPKNNDGPGDFIPPYPVWFCLGWFCPLPAAFWIGRIMKEKKPFLKYGILGKLIKDAHRVIFHPVYLIIVSFRQFESNYRIWFHSIFDVKSALHPLWAWMRLWKLLIDGTKFCWVSQYDFLSRHHICAELSTSNCKLVIFHCLILHRAMVAWL